MKKILKIVSLFMCLAIFSACTPASNPQAASQTAVIDPIEVETTPTPGTSQPTSQQPAARQTAVISDPATVIKNCDELLASFNQKLKTPGWIGTVFSIVYYDNTKNEYRDPQVKEEWYRFDRDGLLAEAYNWVSSQDGAIQQEAIYQGGAWYNVTYGKPAHASSDAKLDFSGGFADQLKSGEKISQEAVSYQKADDWRFYVEMNDGGLRMARALFIDRNSGLISGKETYLVLSDGSLKLVSAVIYTRFEINADPPLQRFQQILEKAQKMH